MVKCKLGDDYLAKIDATAMDEIVRHFSAKIKPMFESYRDPHVQERMLEHRRIRLGGMRDNTEEGIAYGTLKLE